MSIIPVFSGRNAVERALRWLFGIGFLLVIGGLIVLSVSYGVERGYRFEVIALSVDWIILIVAGVLLSRVFRRQMSTTAS